MLSYPTLPSSEHGADIDDQCHIQALIQIIDCATPIFYRFAQLNLRQ
jgi:hypothetical protein